MQAVNVDSTSNPSAQSYSNHGARSSASPIPYSAVLLGSNSDAPADLAPGQHADDEATSSAYQHPQPEPSISLEQHATFAPRVSTDGTSHIGSEESEEKDEEGDVDVEGDECEGEEEEGEEAG